VDRIVAIILAAGESSRMGAPKALLRLGTETFLEHILQNYAAADIRRIVVLGHHSQEIRSKTPLSGVTVLENPDPSRGPLSSLWTALDQLAGSDALIMHPVDHPLVSIDTIKRMGKAHRRIPGCILMPEFRGRRGHPVLFPARFFPDLRGAPLSKGARWVVRASRASNHLVPVVDPGVLVNIDTPKIYEQLTGFPPLVRSD
jgi:molybdenum cofactor cytidylyltransferase